MAPLSGADPVQQAANAITGKVQGLVEARPIPLRETSFVIIVRLEGLVLTLEPIHVLSILSQMSTLTRVLLVLLVIRVLTISRTSSLVCLEPSRLPLGLFTVKFAPWEPLLDMEPQPVLPAQQAITAHLPSLLLSHAHTVPSL
jgi:hypothetical protein